MATTPVGCVDLGRGAPAAAGPPDQRGCWARQGPLEAAAPRAPRWGTSGAPEEPQQLDPAGWSPTGSPRPCLPAASPCGPKPPSSICGGLQPAGTPRVGDCSMLQRGSVAALCGRPPVQGGPEWPPALPGCTEPSPGGPLRGCQGMAARWWAWAPPQTRGEAQVWPKAAGLTGRPPPAPCTPLGSQGEPLAHAVLA